jgi:hypothetical protein
VNVYKLQDSNEPEGQWVKFDRAGRIHTVMHPDERAEFFARHSRFDVERSREYSPKGSKAKLADMTQLGNLSDPVLSARAKSVFEPHLEGLGRWIPLDFDEAPYWLFWLQDVRDVLDRGASKIDYCPSSGRVMGIDRVAFREDALSGLFMWRILEAPASLVCVSDAALDLVRRHQLTGFEFELLWSSKHGALPEGLKNWERPRFTGLETEPFDADAFWAKYSHRQQPAPSR